MVIAVRPLLLGASNATLAWPAPAVATMFVGAPGTVGCGLIHSEVPLDRYELNVIENAVRVPRGACVGGLAAHERRGGGGRSSVP